MDTYVVIPNYIVTEELAELAKNTIASFRQSSNVFIISVDDGSPMNTEFLKELSDVYIRNKENSGFGISCNNGFKHIMKNSGDEDCYIVCANNDIEVNSGCVEALQEPFENYENVGVTGIISTKEREVEGLPIEDFSWRKITEGGQLRDRMQDGGLWMSTKSVLEKVGLFDEQFIRGGYEDVDLFLRMRDKHGLKLVMNGKKWYWHKQGATRWNCEKNNFINNFGRESKSIEEENLEKFIAKWGFNPHQANMWQEREIFND